MEATELMIGDWVYSTFCDKPCKVIGIEQYESEYVNVKVTNVTGAKDINSLSFIPLTPEILEKNGWYVPLLKSWWEHPDIAFWMKAYTDGTFELMIDEDSDISFCTIRFVHELQHALRLCGLNELADNFKV